MYKLFESKEARLSWIWITVMMVVTSIHHVFRLGWIRTRPPHHHSDRSALRAHALVCIDKEHSGHEDLFSL